MPVKALLIAVLLLLSGFAALGAQEEESPEEDPFRPQILTNERALGDQAFAISLGVYIPLFTVLLHDWPAAENTSGVKPANLNVGGTGSLTYSVYVSSNIKLGFQLAGAFASDINGNFAYSIPLMLKGSYEFHPWGRVSIPVHLGLGIAMTSWKEENFSVDLLIRPGFGVYFDWSYEWSFGLDVSYWIIPQLPPAKEQRSVFNALDVTLTAEYHF